MGCDITVCFSDTIFTPDEIGMALMRQATLCQKVYIVLGTSPPPSTWSFFFTIWADAHMEIEAVSLLLSKLHSATICIAWKSEHGGVAGYRIIRNGIKTAEVEDSGDEYLLQPGIGVELAFGRKLLNRNDWLIFPESELDSNVECYHLDRTAGNLTQLSSETITQLMEGDLEVEPIMPMEL